MNTDHQLDIAGACVFWNCATSSNREQIQQDLSSMGHADLCPGERTTFAAAKRAASLLYSGSAYHVGNLEDRRGVTIERVVHSETENDYPQIAYITVDEDERTCGITVTDLSLSWAAKTAAEESLMSEFRRQLFQCGATAIGVALTKACQKFGGTRLRKNGGLFFVPSFSADEFEKVANVFEKWAEDGETLVEQLTVAKSDKTLRGVHNALRANVTQRIDEIKKELHENLGKRGCVTREAEIERLLDQSRAYETLLGASLEEVRNDLTDLKREVIRHQIAKAAANERESNESLQTA